MSSPKVDLSSSKISNINQIQAYAQQLKKSTTNDTASNIDLILENKKILDILKKIESKIDKQLQIQKKNMLATNPHHKSVFNKDQIKILEEKQTNNSKLLTVLEKDLQNTLFKRKLYEDGHEQKVREKKNSLEDKIIEIKNELKQLHLQQKSQQKKLASFQNFSQAWYLKQYARMQQQLRIHSAKYVKVLARHTKITQQLAISSQTIQPQFEIPQEINSQLDQRQEKQYKQYQSILKLCTILAKRNDSENNKANRIYTQKLKDLQKTIINLTQLEKAIEVKQTEILQGKKNVDMIKLKLTNKEKVDKELFRLSYASRNTMLNQQTLRKKSFSSAKITALQNSVTQNTYAVNNNKLRSRGLSFGKLPTKLKM